MAQIIPGPVPSLPTDIAQGASYDIPAASQKLSVTPISIEGTLTLEGTLGIL